ncbi:MAG TPA: FecR family protein [Bacteroidales bacterium]
MGRSEDQLSLVNELSIKFLSGNITIEEIKQLQGLLLDDAESLQLFLDIKESWISASSYQYNSENIDTDNSWGKVKASINEQADIKHFSIGKFLRIAALWLSLLVLGSGITLIVQRKGAEIKQPLICEISTPLGSRSRTVLPDGSEVWLNGGTTIRYPESFSSKQRDIYLTGEAFFKVKANKKWPFVVHASDVRIKALGTAFNVKAYPIDKTVVTTLVEGIVNMENESKAKKEFTYTLKPKEKLTYYKSPDSKEFNKDNAQIQQSKETFDKTNQSAVVVNENVNTTLSTSWKDPRWVIDGETLDNLAVLLERRFGVKINLISEELSRYKFSGTIENETLEQVLKYLKLTTPVKYTVKKGYVDLVINEAIKDNYKSFLKQSSSSTN